MRPTSLVPILMAGSLLLATAPAAEGQRRTASRAPSGVAAPVAPVPSVDGARPGVVRLSKGGDAKTLEITGDHLERLARGRVESRGVVMDVDVALPPVVTRNPRRGVARRSVRLSARPSSRAGNRMTLILTTARDARGRTTEVEIPVRIVVRNAVRIDRATLGDTLQPTARAAVARLTLRGAGLLQLHHPRLVRNGRRIPGTEVVLDRNAVNASDAVLGLVLTVGVDVPPGPAEVWAGTVDRPMKIADVWTHPRLAIREIRMPETLEGAPQALHGTVVLENPAAMPARVVLSTDGAVVVEANADYVRPGQRSVRLVGYVHATGRGYVTGCVAPLHHSCVPEKTAEIMVDGP